MDNPKEDGKAAQYKGVKEECDLNFHKVATAYVAMQDAGIAIGVVEIKFDGA